MTYIMQGAKFTEETECGTGLAVESQFQISLEDRSNAMWISKRVIKKGRQ